MLFAVPFPSYLRNTFLSEPVWRIFFVILGGLLVLAAVFLASKTTKYILSPEERLFLDVYPIGRSLDDFFRENRSISSLVGLEYSCSRRFLF